MKKITHLSMQEQNPLNKIALASEHAATINSLNKIPVIAWESNKK